jgi:hypothetical protein
MLFLFCDHVNSCVAQIFFGIMSFCLWMNWKFINLFCELSTENGKEYGKGKLKYKEQRNTAWIGGAMDILDEEGVIVVSSTHTDSWVPDFFKIVCITESSASLMI